MAPGANVIPVKVLGRDGAGSNSGVMAGIDCTFSLKFVLGSSFTSELLMFFFSFMFTLQGWFRRRQRAPGRPWQT